MLAIPGLFEGMLPATAAAALYVVTGIVYRLYLSPIAHFPGPKLAAVTYWYGFYYDAVCGGQYVWKVQQMHEKYGPAVRINPDEIHVADPDFYAVLYAGGQERRDKVLKHTRQFGMPDSMLFTIPQDVHRTRRAVLNPFFSKASVNRLAPVIQAKVDELLERMEGLRASGEPIPLFAMFAAYTNDVVMQYAFARSDQRLAQPDFDPGFLNALLSASEMSHWLLHLNWLLVALQSLPLWLSKMINPGLGKILSFQDRIKHQIQDMLDDKDRRRDEKSPGDHRTIFHDVLDADMPASEKRLERIWQEGMVVVGAGTDTTAWTLVVALVNILVSSDVRRRLESELAAAAVKKDKRVLALSDLEQLPYLSACVKESLRLSYGLSARLPRVAPTQVLQVPGTAGLAIPAGAKVSMSAALMHRHPRAFPDPDRFSPERWLENPRLDRYLVSFSKGARQCLGINLAYAELYMALGGIFRRFAAASDDGQGGPRLGLLKGEEASLRDVQIAGDMFLPSVKGDKMVKAIFR